MTKRNSSSELVVAPEMTDHHGKRTRSAGRTVTGVSAAPFLSLEKALFPPNYRLLVGTSQIYELELAVAETRVLTESEIIERGAYFESVDGVKTNHFRMCAVSPLQVDATTSSRRKTFFEANLFKTGYAAHGLFPYRGKFHPQMIKAVINIIGLKAGEVLLDPMMGSGTACLEATIQGVKAVGVDASPFCVLMAEGKQAGVNADPEVVSALEGKGHELFERFHRSESQLPLFGLRAGGDAWPKERKIVGKGLHAFLKLCYLDAMGYAVRRASKSARQLFPVVLQRYVSAALNFARIRDELGIHIAEARYRQGDARNLKQLRIADESIDGIVTSPPYSFAIDYLANDAKQLEYMDVDIERLRNRMIGLRGRTLSERIEKYLADMTAVFSECSRVLKSGRYAVLVVGTNSNQLKRVMGTDGDDFRIDTMFVEIARGVGFELVQDIIHPIEGIHNTLRDEHVLFFCKG